MMKTSTWGVVLALSQVIVSATQAASTAPQTRVLDQLTPDNSVVLLIDYQPQYAFSTRSTDIDSLVNNAVGLAKAARVFKVPTVVTTITAQAFAGPLLQPLKAATEIDPIDRTVINAWRDERVSKAVRATGRKKIVMAGLWTDNCVMLPALSALAEGFEVYVVTDASGDYDPPSHERAIQRLVQAGAVPITWLPVMLEWQADWSRSETSGAVGGIIREHAAAMSAGAQYRQSMYPPDTGK
jgi:nicotinamidase-related amidase